ncbi:TPA: hypothetical protein ACHVYG_004646, partial [Escherichia coli]
TADRNRSHWSTSKTPSYTKSVSWQHHRLIRCICGKKIGPDPRNFNQRVSWGRNDLLIRTFPNFKKKHLSMP